MFHGMSQLILWQLFICDLGIWLSAWLTHTRPTVWAHYCMTVHPMNSGTAVGEAEGWILWLVWKRWNSVSKHKQTNASAHKCETKERGNKKRRWKGGEGRRKRKRQRERGEARGKTRKGLNYIWKWTHLDTPNELQHLQINKQTVTQKILSSCFER